MTEPPSSSSTFPWWQRHLDALFCVAAVAVCLGFTLVTHNIWEDFFITFRHSRNLCEGQGLVYEAGQRVHGFTSPLGVLLPALCHWLTGMRSHLHALWAFRLLFSIPAFVLGGLLLVRLVRRLTPERPLAPAVAGTLYLLEVKSVAFSTNGMETGLLLLFFAWSLSLLLSGDHLRRWPWLGVAWAGMMWTRPDACVHVAVLGLGALAFADRAAMKTSLAAMLKAAAVAAALYLPWFVWAWWYYGSPVPHTVLAKGAMLAGSGWWAQLTATLGRLPRCVGWVFGPVYPHFFSWPVAVRWHMILLGASCFLYWLLPWFREDRAGRRCSLMFCLSALYLAVLSFPYPWYFACATTLGIVVLARGLDQAVGRFAPERRRRAAVMAGWGVMTLSAALLFGLETYRLRLQQRIVEDGVRTKLGLWLRERAAPGDRIYLECLGYIGYFSGGRMLDFPGLATPEVVALRREHGLDFYSLPVALRPEWMVLRLHEFMRMQARQPRLMQEYAMAEIFEGNDALDEHLFIPGESFLLYDIFLVVCRRKDPALPPARPKPDSEDRTGGPDSGPAHEVGKATEVQGGHQTMTKRRVAYGSLVWLRDNQNPDGSWGAEDATGALLGFCLMAYRGHGETPASAEFGESALKAIDQAVSMAERQDIPDPVLAMGLTESYDVTRIPRLKEPMEKAIRKIIANQHPDGEFKHAGQDLLGLKHGNALWQSLNLMVLEDADGTDYGDDDQTKRQELLSAIKIGSVYLERAFYLPDQGGFKLQSGDRAVSPLATAASAWALLCCLEYRDQAYDSAITWVTKRAAAGWDESRDDYPLLTRHFINKCRFAIRGGMGQEWADWHRSYTQALLQQQAADGSWNLEIGPMPMAEGDRRVFSTALSSLMHYVYYAYKPSSKATPAPAPVPQPDDGLRID